MPVRLICDGRDLAYGSEAALGLTAFAPLVIKTGSSALLRAASIRP